MADDAALARTPLYDVALAAGGRMTAFEGWALPAQFADGVLGETRTTRESASLFDVSHMGRGRLEGQAAAAVLERLSPGDFSSLAPGEGRYALFLNDAGGIEDDFIALRDPDTPDSFFVVVNASRRDADFARLDAEAQNQGARWMPEPVGAMVALQGPASAALLAAASDGEPVPSSFMRATRWSQGLFVARCGYTGEDGFEISGDAAQVAALAARLAAPAGARWAGLGARDALRLEAGLRLYGADMDASTSIIEAGLGWTAPKHRREEGGFRGHTAMMATLRDGAERRFVGLMLEDKGVARAGALVNEDGEAIGAITSGGFSPTLRRSIAMGYLRAEYAVSGGIVLTHTRGRAMRLRIVPLPFTLPRQHREPKP